ncbi:MAG: glycosyltransferase [Ilumatobacteraceae bacterium]
MRVLFTTQPGVGHLLPLLPVADGLRDRGHEVLFAVSASFGPEISAAGHSSRPAGRDWLATQMVAAFPAMAAIPPGPERYAWARSSVFAGATARDSVDDITAIAREWHADLVVRDAAEYGGCLAAELLDLPHAVVRTDSGSSSYADRSLVGPALDAIRVDVGLAADPDVAMPFRYLQLSFAPPGLDEPDQAAAPTAHRIRPVVPADGNGAPAWLEALPDQRTVYATLGTVYNDTALLSMIIDGLAAEALNLVVTVGHNREPAAIDPHRPNVKVEHWIPQHALLPHCDAVITHGGYGTVTAAMTHGCPLVLMPISADQPRNAVGCTALGVGLTIDPHDRTPERIRTATTAVLERPEHRQAAQDVARDLRQRPDLEHALDLLETLAAQRVPLPRSDAAA